MKAKVIGKSKLFDLPEEEFYLVYCSCCESLINVPKENINKEFFCLCGNKIKI